MCKKCTNLSGWILRAFSTRDITTMLTLFKSLVLSRLDYASQLWSPHLVKHIDQLEKIQRSFTKHITGMQGLDYSDRLVFLKLHSLQRRRERYCRVQNGSPGSTRFYGPVHLRRYWSVPVSPGPYILGRPVKFSNSQDADNLHTIRKRMPIPFQ